MLSDDQDASGPTGGGRAPGLIRLGLLTALITGVLDQANKWWMLTVYDIDQKGQVAVLPFMDLVYVLNRGISYGLFTQSDQRGQYMLAGIAVVVSVGLLIWLMRGEQNRLSAVSIGLIVGGALANAIDRIHLGGVADFLPPNQISPRPGLQLPRGPMAVSASVPWVALRSSALRQNSSC
jgi:lipoprotein signal peptidase